ncbi:F-box CPR30-like [Olea europaea subsp. europaea]|uniref:F-box CPR30-like n=1 Tax=Olea europaea subsp. europaea TaxID=158383 RepID=A0A8S0VLR9_OLEEU|nr:F-box CPR30-like [Olea europaea subsp. europaea]
MNPNLLESLPLELVTAILLLLPTKDLVRFLCVCKTWRDLIRDPIFIKKHFRYWASKANGYLLYKSGWLEQSRTFRLLCDKVPEQVLEIEIPFEPVTYEGKKRFINFPIPDIPGIKQSRISEVLGFGYHDQTNDYKIIRIAYHEYGKWVEDHTSDDSFYVYEGVKSRVDVYSLNSNSCRRIEVDNFPWTVFQVTSGVLVNNSVHWMALRRDLKDEKFMIVTFHLEREVFLQISFPNYSNDEADLWECIGVLEENLSLFVFHDIEPWQTCHLWVMMEYGVGSSWTKMYSVCPYVGIRTAISFTENGEIILKAGKHEVLALHSKARDIQERQIQKKYEFNLVRYVDSLVLLRSDTKLVEG